MTGKCEVSSQERDVGISINLLVDSEKRKNLLLLLRYSPRTLNEIKDSLSVSSSGIIPEIRKMVDKQLIYHVDRKYALTEIGGVVAEYFCNLEQILKIFNGNRKFWSEHKISGIPEEFRLRLHELGKYEIFKSTPTDIFRPHNEYMKNLLKARWMKGLTPVLHPDYPKYVFDLTEKGAHASIILTRELFESINKENRAELEKGLSTKNVCIMVCDEKIEFVLAVTDFFLSLRLFLKDDTYDFYQNIISFEKSAILWGEDLFNYFAERSKKVGIQDI